jgi:pyruvate kinase
MIMIDGIQITATLGPAVYSDTILPDFLQSGVDLVRINGSHMAEDDIRFWVSRLHSEGIQVLLDTPGPEFRIAGMEQSLFLKSGQMVLIGEQGDFSITPDLSYEKLSDFKSVLLECGKVELKPERLAAEGLYCQVIREGAVKPGAHAHIPGYSGERDFLTDCDKSLLKLASELKIDSVALSYVGNVCHLNEVKQYLSDKNYSRPKLYAKIESLEAVKNLDSLMHEVDALIFARGDLGIEIPFFHLPLIQQRVVSAVKGSIPVVLATEMLYSMVQRPFPTRAEVTDVYLALQQGFSGLLLSDETAIGRYPLESVAMLGQIIKGWKEGYQC